MDGLDVTYDSCRYVSACIPFKARDALLVFIPLPLYNEIAIKDVL